jgi:hypothetical protein
MGIQMIPAYSPQARGRSERGFGTWQGRLPQELRLRGITTVDEANRFLREEYCQEFTHRFGVAPGEKGTAFVPLRRKDLDLVFSIQHERVVARDNTEHLDETVSMTFGPHLVGRYNSEAVLLEAKPKTKAMEMPPLRKAMPPLRKAIKSIASLSGLEKSRQKAA